MDNSFDDLKQLIEQLKTIGFFERLFSWKRVREKLMDAIADMQKITTNSDTLTERISELKRDNSDLYKDLELAKASTITQSSEIANFKSTIQDQNSKLSKLTADNASNDTTIENQKNRIAELENKHVLLVQRNDQLIKDNSSSSEEIATTKEDLRKTTERKNELEIAIELSKQKNEQLTSDNKRYSGENATDREALRKIAERKNELKTSNDLLTQKNEQLIADNKKYSQEIATDKESLIKTTERKNELEIDLGGLRINVSNLQVELSHLKHQNTQLTTEEESRRIKYERDASTLTSIKEQIQRDRNEEIEARSNAEIERLKSLKETWNKHQGNVKNIVKSICNKHVIEYVDKFPFKGEPDNTLKICDEYIVFDAKSPGADDLTNFPNYLKDQAEKAKKYAKQDGVKKDIFFVVPTNTLEKLNQFVFNLGDHDVFIISVDSLEQIILGLKKIESYEFAEKLSPEERDNICRVLGKFAHLTKRRIQIDSFFAKQFIELAYKSETDLPKEFLDKVIEFEKSEKINPPIERRAKSISIKELDIDITKLKSEATAKGIFFDESKISESLNELQLYQKDPEE